MNATVVVRITQERSMLRTIKYWAVYDPLTRLIVGGGKTKNEAKTGCPSDCVLVQMKGNYMPKVKRS